MGNNNMSGGASTPISNGGDHSPGSPNASTDDDSSDEVEAFFNDEGADTLIVVQVFTNTTNMGKPKIHEAVMVNMTDDENSTGCNFLKLLRMCVNKYCKSLKQYRDQDVKCCTTPYGTNLRGRVLKQPLRKTLQQVLRPNEQMHLTFVIDSPSHNNDNNKSESSRVLSSSRQNPKIPPNPKVPFNVTPFRYPPPIASLPPPLPQQLRRPPYAVPPFVPTSAAAAAVTRYAPYRLPLPTTVPSLPKGYNNLSNIDKWSSRELNLILKNLALVQHGKVPEKRKRLREHLEKLAENKKKKRRKKA